MNLFQKCLMDAFGKETYKKYVLFCFQQKEFFQSLTERSVSKFRSPENDPVGKYLSDDMHQMMEKEQGHKLEQRVKSIQNTVGTFEHIRVNFRMVVLLYLVACFMLIGFELEPLVTVAGLVIMSVCFLYKVYEYTINQHCFVDVYLIILYQNVLQDMTRKRA